jgi:isocitrate lyase
MASGHDANVAGEMYPDQSLYPANSVPLVIERINNALLRADQIQVVNGTTDKRISLVLLLPMQKQVLVETKCF